MNDVYSALSSRAQKIDLEKFFIVMTIKNAYLQMVR